MKNRLFMTCFFFCKIFSLDLPRRLDEAQVDPYFSAGACESRAGAREPLRVSRGQSGEEGGAQTLRGISHHIPNMSSGDNEKGGCCAGQAAPAG